MEQLIELACDASDGGYFHSENPLEAARFVVSHAVSALWQTVLDQHGFGQFARRAAPQLIRWESRYGWARWEGQVSEHESSLARVLESMLATPDMWVAFAGTGWSATPPSPGPRSPSCAHAWPSAGVTSPVPAR